MGIVESRMSEKQRGNIRVRRLAAGSSGDNETYLAATDSDQIKFNPSRSRCIFIGVGQQKAKDLNGVGYAADNDAHVMHQVFRQSFKVPESNLTLLTSDGQKRSTKAEIKSAIKRNGEEIGPEGTLLVYFSGHCSKGRNEDMLLVPQDFTRADPNSVINLSKVKSYLKKCRATSLVLILDCCYAGAAASSVTSQWDLPLSLYVIAACSSAESALSHNILSNGFFTFTLSAYFEKVSTAEKEVLDLQSCLDYCTPLCQAMVALCSPTTPGDLSMSPEVHAAEEAEGEDMVDDASVPALRRPFAYLDKYYMVGRYHDGAGGGLASIGPPPPSVTGYLEGVALPALRILNEARLLDCAALRCDEAGDSKSATLHRAVLVFMAQAGAALMLEHFSRTESPPRSLLRASWFLTTFSYIGETLRLVDERLAPTLRHVALTLKCYIFQVCGLLNVHDPNDMTELLTVHKWIYDDAASERSAADPGDCVDGLPGIGAQSQAPSLTDRDLLAAFEDVQKLSDLQVSPDISFAVNVELTDSDE